MKSCRTIYSQLLSCSVSKTPHKLELHVEASRHLLTCLCIHQVVGVRKEYKTKGGIYIGADGINLEIQAGKMTALLGPSGSGRVVS